MDAPRRPRLLQVLDPWLLFVALIWGGNFVIYKLLLEKVTPLTIIGVRFGLMAPPLLLLARLLPGRRPFEREHLPCLLWAGLVVQSLQQISFILAVDMTSATEASLLITTMPIWAAIIAVLAGQERLARLNLAGVAVGFAGVALVVLGGRAMAGQDLPRRLLGDGIMIASAALYAYYMVLVKPLVEEHGGLSTVAYSYSLTALVVVPAAGGDLLATNWSALSALDWFYLVGYIGLLAGVLGFTLWYTALGRASAARTAVYQYLVPVVAMATAAVFLHERVNLLQLVGAGVTLAGLVMTRWPADGRPG